MNREDLMRRIQALSFAKVETELFLDTHPEFSLRPVKNSLISATAPGLDGMVEARRFYPHLTKGEGQFIALMQKSEDSGRKSTIQYKENVKLPTKDELAAFSKFRKENIDAPLDGRIIKWGESLALISHDLPIPPYSVFMPGVLLGEVKKGNFFPHHQLFSAYGERFLRRENLKRDDERVVKYLRGEEIDSEIQSGWCAVCYEGVSLGGGKASNGRIKNHYPKGLRNN